MSRLTRDGTAEPVSRAQILRHARGQGNIIFSVQLTTSRIGNLTRLIHTLLYVMTIHTYIHTYDYRLVHFRRTEVPTIQVKLSKSTAASSIVDLFKSTQQELKSVQPFTGDSANLMLRLDSSKFEKYT